MIFLILISSSEEPGSTSATGIMSINVDLKEPCPSSHVGLCVQEPQASQYSGDADQSVYIGLAESSDALLCLMR